MTVAFAGGAFVLLLAGGALSLVWFGRLPYGGPSPHRSA